MSYHTFIKKVLLFGVMSFALTSCINDEAADTKGGDTAALAPKLNCKMGTAKLGQYTGLFYGMNSGGKQVWYYGRGRCAKAGEAEGMRTLDQYTMSQVAYVDTVGDTNFKPSKDNEYQFQLSGASLSLVRGDDRIPVGEVIEKREWAQLKLAPGIVLNNLLISKDGTFRSYNSQTDGKAKFEQRYIHIIAKR